MNALFSFLKRLDDSNGLVKVNHNNAMQAASQTPKTPWFLRIQEALNLRGLARAPSALAFFAASQTKTAENVPQTTTTEQKTLPNRIGLGKKAIIAVLALATALTPLQTQAFTLLDLLIAISQTQQLANQLANTSTNSVREISSGTVYPIASSTDSLQNGDQIQAVWNIMPILGGIGSKIPWKKWLKRIAGFGAGELGTSAVWNAVSKRWELPPGAVRKGKIQAIGTIELWKLDGEKSTWHHSPGTYGSFRNVRVQSQ